MRINKSSVRAAGDPESDAGLLPTENELGVTVVGQKPEA